MNNGTKQWSKLLLSLIIAIGLAACSRNSESNDTGTANPSSPRSSAPSSSSAAPSASAITPSPSASAAVSPSASTMPATSAKLPETKTFTMKLEGSEEQKTAKLAQGNGYALYIFDGFTFDADAGKLMMDIDENYYVEITKLPSGYDQEQLKKDAGKQLAKLGEVRELEEPNPLIGDTAFFVQASNDKVTNQVILKEVDGAGFLCKVNMPHTEASEGFGPHAFLSMSSIVNQ